MIAGSSIVVSLLSITMIAYLTLTEMKTDALNKVQSDLISKKTLIANELTSYFSTIENQAVALAADIATKEAAKAFNEGFFKYPSGADDKVAMANYYQGAFKRTYDGQNKSSINVGELYNSLPNSTLALQAQFIALNPNKVGEKDKLTDLSNATLYAAAHKHFHPSFHKFQQVFGYYDVFLVEPKTGFITYSVFKEVDYATSLKSGPYSQSGIGDAFRQALKLKEGEVYFTDFAPYTPSYDNAASFIASPVYENGELLSVLIFQIPLDKINAIATQNGDWIASGFGKSGEVYLVGQDKVLRTESREFLQSPNAYFSTISSLSGQDAERIKMKGSTISTQVVDTESVAKALRGETGVNAGNIGYLGQRVLSAFSPISMGQQKWGIISEMREDEALKSVSQLSDYITKLALLIVAVVAIVALLIALLMARSLTKPLNTLANRFEELATGEADLRARLPDTNIPEINRIVVGFNGFMQEMSGIFGNVKDSVARIASSSTELGSTMEQTTVTLNEQKNAISQIYDSVEAFRISVDEITQRTEDTSVESHQAKSKTEYSVKRAQSAVSNIRQLVGEVKETSDTIKNLQLSVDEISTVLGVITSIAEQTNLLALNAAIEAARAGEYGRGFAVVADEVRNLASRTQQSTVTIHEQIGQLVETAKRSYEAMERANLSAETGITMVEEVSDSLTELTGTIIHLSELSAEVAASTDRQGDVIMSITQSMTSLSERASEVTDSSSNVSEVANELSSVAELLKSETDKFTV